ncbi:MAG: hypothetical protein LBT78_09565 [Tannerella sp.]|jgi:hypothetical protein|nr:hypothetical protein [Tannerella sp.]
MAKKRKQKATVVRTSVGKTSKNQFDRRADIACKTLKAVGYPDIFDTLSKNQKKYLLSFTIEEPDIRSEKPNTVPRHYVNKIRNKIFDILRTNRVGDPSIGLSYMEFVSFGAGFMDTFKNSLTTMMFTDKQKEIISRGDDFNSYTELLRISWINIAAHLSQEIQRYSQIRFRTYGHTMEWSTKNIPLLLNNRLVIRLTSRESEKIHFRHKNLKRLAYRIWTGDAGMHNNMPVTIPVQKLFPYSDSDKNLELFIQAHAIHRYKERFDIFQPPGRNYLILSSLFLQQKVKMGFDGPMITCTVEDAAFGYFPFTVQGDKLFILTFLPPINDMTYEGKKFMDMFHLKKEDLIHLGMDKLSFYEDVDFEQIPVLEKALIDLDLFGVNDTLVSLTNYEPEYDPARTAFVKSFFEKQCAQIDNSRILDELVAREENDL